MFKIGDHVTHRHAPEAEFIVQGFTCSGDVILERVGQQNNISWAEGSDLTVKLMPVTEYRWTNLYAPQKVYHKARNGLLHYSAWYATEEGCIDAGQRRRDNHGVESWLASIKVKLVGGVPTEMEPIVPPDWAPYGQREPFFRRFSR